MTLTIYHKPNCATSRKALALIRAAGETPVVINYLEKPPTRAKLVSLLKRLNMTPRDFIRRKEPLFDELGLGDAGWSDEQLIDVMLAHPILIDRPVVVSGRRAVLARPPEKIFELLPGAGERLEQKDRKGAAAKGRR